MHKKVKQSTGSRFVGQKGKSLDYKLKSSNFSLVYKMNINKKILGSWLRGSHLLKSVTAHKQKDFLLVENV